MIGISTLSYFAWQDHNYILLGKYELSASQNLNKSMCILDSKKIINWKF